MRRLQLKKCGFPFDIFTFLLSFSLTAQTSYYWSNNRKIEISEDQTAVNIQFFEKQNKKELEQNLQNNKSVQSFEYQSTSKRLLVHFYQKIEQSKVLSSLNLQELKFWDILGVSFDFALQLLQTCFYCVAKSTNNDELCLGSLIMRQRFSKHSALSKSSK